MFVDSYKRPTSNWKMCLLIALSWAPQAIARERCPTANDNLILFKLDNKGTGGIVERRNQIVEVGTTISWISDTSWAAQSPTPVKVDITPVTTPALCNVNPTSSCTINSIPDPSTQYTYTYCSNPSMLPSACPSPGYLIHHEITVRKTPAGTGPRVFRIRDVTLALDDPNHLNDVNHVIPEEDTCVRWRLYDTQDIDTNGDVDDVDIRFKANPPASGVTDQSRSSVEIPASRNQQVDSKYSICDASGQNCVDPTLHILKSGQGGGLSGLLLRIGKIVTAIIVVVAGIFSVLYYTRRRTA